MVNPLLVVSAVMPVVSLIGGYLLAGVGRESQRYEGEAAIINALVNAAQMAHSDPQAWEALISASPSPAQKLLLRYVKAAEQATAATLAPSKEVVLP